ncbi:MAG: metallophosphoesterase family protein [Rhodocyclaceae bacterium]|nr:metallophosphoesterase family protein [Rhodocyclaceae bacterium]
MPKDFFTSDHHFGHEHILGYCRETRPYKSVEDMALDYRAKWNGTVAPDDTVYYLGDFSLTFAQVEEWLPHLNGRKHLIMGNHDAGWKRLVPEQLARYQAAGFESVASSGTVMVAGVRLALSHFPYRVPDRFRSPDERIAAEEAHFAARSLVSGTQGEAGLLHGHLHQHFRGRKQPARLPEVNVGVDAWGGTPVSGETLLAALKKIRNKGEDGVLGIYGEWVPAGEDCTMRLHLRGRA